MADLSFHYPLVRRRRRRWWRWRWTMARPGRRLVAAAVLVAVALAAGLAWRGMRADPREAYRAGLAAMADGRFAAARTSLRTALAVEPVAAQLALARVAVEEEDATAADAAVQRAAAARAPAAALHALRAAAMLLADDAEGALAEAGRAPAADGRLATRIRARALDAGDDPAGAERLLTDLLATAPREAGAWVDLGRVRIGRGDLAGAETAARRALALDGRSPAALTLEGDVVASRYGPAASLPWYAAALDRDPNFVPALLPRAAALGEVGRAREALAAARRALDLRPASRQPRYLMAVIAARAGNVALARRLLQAMDDAADAVPGALWLGGWLAQAEGHGDLAIAKWQQLLDDQPMNVALRRLLGVALLRSGDARGALETLTPLIGRADADSETLELAARAARAVGDPRAAVLHDRAIGGARGPSTVFADDDGVAALGAAAASAPDDPDAAVALVRGLIASGDAVGAAARARGMVEASPGAAAAQLALGDALIAAGRAGDAAAAYARAADLRFDEPAMLRLVDALGRAGRADEAARALALYLSQNPRSLAARRLTGHWQAVAGDAHAAATLEAVRRQVGDRNAGLLADLALAWQTDPRRARDYAAAAYRLAPMNRAIVRLYAAVLAGAGDAEGARQLTAKDKALTAAG